MRTRPPKLNYAGSSGSYLMRDSTGSFAGIFKPKDEEPYGRLNRALSLEVVLARL
jgi:hypothetical protein